MTNVRMIASDLDKTLLKNDNSLPAGIFDRIEFLHRAGIEFVAASGRGIYTLEELFAPVSAHMSFLAENGGIIKSNGRIIHENYLSDKQVQTIVSFVRQQPGVIAIGNGLEATYLDSDNSRYLKELSFFISKFNLVSDLAFNDKPIAKISLYFPEGNAYAKFAPLYSSKFEDEFGVTIGGPNFIDIMPKQTNKGYGLRLLGDALGISPSQMMACGDTNNDIEMLQTVGYPVLVDNATPNMRQYGRFHTATNQAGGVLQAIDRVLAGRLPDLLV